MSKIVVDIIGFPGSGKSSVCEHLAVARGFKVYRPSDVLRRYARQHGIPLKGHEDYVRCNRELQQADPDALIRPILADDAARICLDGLRAPATYKRAKNTIGATLIYLACPIEERFARARFDVGRKGHRRLVDLGTFRNDEVADYHNDDPTLPSMDDMVAMANYIVDASRPFAAVLRDIDTIISRL